MLQTWDKQKPAGKKQTPSASAEVNFRVSQGKNWPHSKKVTANELFSIAAHTSPRQRQEVLHFENSISYCLAFSV